MAVIRFSVRPKAILGAVYLFSGSGLRGSRRLLQVQGVILEAEHEGDGSFTVTVDHKKARFLGVALNVFKGHLIRTEILEPRS